MLFLQCLAPPHVATVATANDRHSVLIDVLVVDREGHPVGRPLAVRDAVTALRLSAVLLLAHGELRELEALDPERLTDVDRLGLDPQVGE